MELHIFCRILFYLQKETPWCPGLFQRCQPSYMAVSIITFSPLHSIWVKHACGIRQLLFQYGEAPDQYFFYLWAFLCCQVASLHSKFRKVLPSLLPPGGRLADRGGCAFILYYKRCSVLSIFSWLSLGASFTGSSSTVPCFPCQTGDHR